MARMAQYDSREEEWRQNKKSLIGEFIFTLKVGHNYMRIVGGQPIDLTQNY